MNSAPSTSALVLFSFLRFCSVPREKKNPTDVGRRVIVLAEESCRSPVTHNCGTGPKGDRKGPEL